MSSEPESPAPRLLMETFNMGSNGEPLAHGRIWSGPLKLLLPALCNIPNIFLHLCSVFFLGGGAQPRAPTLLIAHIYLPIIEIVPDLLGFITSDGGHERLFSARRTALIRHGQGRTVIFSL